MMLSIIDHKPFWCKLVRLAISKPNRVGEYLKELRRERGLSADQAARRAGCTAAVVNRLEEGQAAALGTRPGPSLALVWSLTKALGGDPMYALSLLAAEEGWPEGLRAALVAIKDRPSGDVVAAPAGMSRAQQMILHLWKTSLLDAVEASLLDAATALSLDAVEEDD